MIEKKHVIAYFFQKLYKKCRSMDQMLFYVFLQWFKLKVVKLSGSAAASTIRVAAQFSVYVCLAYVQFS
jgi:hypothetical protein